MLTHPTLDLLHKLGLHGMAKGFKEFERQPEATGLAHAEWVQLAGLALFGVALATVSYRTGRLGMNMVAHASFNLVAVVTILNQRGGVIH